MNRFDELISVPISEVIELLKEEASKFQEQLKEVSE